MRSLRYGLVLEVRKDAIREENGDTVVTDPELERQVRDRFGQEPERIYLTPGDNEDPVLFIRWRSLPWEDDESNCTVDYFTYSEEELRECYRLGIL